MAQPEAQDPAVLQSYEGLIFATTERWRRFIDEDPEDIRQILRVKVYKALLAYKRGQRPHFSEVEARNRWVHQCVRNQVKDLMKRKPRPVESIEDVAPAELHAEDSHSGVQSRDRFEFRHLSCGHDDVYGAIEAEAVLVPNTLTVLELQVIVLLYRDYRQSEIARELDLDRRAMDGAMRGIRQKMADWKPGPGAPKPALAVAA